MIEGQLVKFVRMNSLTCAPLYNPCIPHMYTTIQPMYTTHVHHYTTHVYHTYIPLFNPCIPHIYTTIQPMYTTHVHHYITHVYHTCTPLYNPCIPHMYTTIQQFWVWLPSLLHYAIGRILAKFRNCLSEPLGSPFFSVRTFLVLCCLQIHCHLFTLQAHS